MGVLPRKTHTDALFQRQSEKHLQQLKVFVNVYSDVN